MKIKRSGLLVSTILMAIVPGFLSGCSSDSDQQAQPEETVQTTDDEEAADVASTAPSEEIVANTDSPAPEALEEVPSAGETEAPPAEANETAVEANADTTDPEAAPASEPVIAAEETKPAAPELAAASSEKSPEVGSGTDRESFTYTIVTGDTLSKIAKRIYGSGSEWRQIATASELSNPDLIYPGHKLTIPVLNAQARQFMDRHVDLGTPGEGKFVTVVKQGDTLSSLAQQNLGSSKFWKQIYEQNRDAISNPNMLKVGIKISYDGATTAH
jgi:nucleoid-associated protein YgaU